MVKDITGGSAAIAAGAVDGAAAAVDGAAAAADAAGALIDIGVNLTHDSFDADREAVMARAAGVGVVQMVVTGSDARSSQQALGLALAHPGRLFATAGLHPHHAAELDTPLEEQLRQLGQRPEIVAIGECGLDYFRNLSPPAAQRRAFQRQLQLAAELQKPVFLHQRDAHADFSAMVREFRGQLRDAVAHCFTGTQDQLHCYLELGLAIGITGWICDERRGRHLLPLLPQIPAGRLMLETDAPYLLPRDVQPRPSSRRNEPAWLAHIAATVARARHESLASIAASSTAAARVFFGLPSPAPASP
ncbi:MAG: TatD family hydrolase [Sinobacteraceae bacterium]|nr:TatD family hydrolase [Nevskiaceae bacterium]